VPCIAIIHTLNGATVIVLELRTVLLPCSQYLLLVVNEVLNIDSTRLSFLDVYRFNVWIDLVEARSKVSFGGEAGRLVSVTSLI
jgi:hypothetical protein